MATEILNGILSKIGEYLLEATIHQLGYLFRFKSNVEDLMKEDENLRLALDRVQQEVHRAIGNTEEIEKDVQKWLTDVGNVITDVQKLEQEIQENKTCLSGWCPNLAWRYRLSRKAERRRSIALKLLELSGKFQRVSHRTDLPGIEFSASRDFASFESTRSTFDQVIEALRDETISMVGIYGMGGVGKTTLAKEIGKQVKELNIFSKVVLAAVTQTPVLRNIQDQIADSLNLKLDEKSEDGRARRLWMRLKDENKILIILDDVWAKIDLTTIGIPSGDDDQKGRKILLTTRRTHVCTIMGCGSNIPLNVLKEEEGLALLKKTAGVGDHDLPTLNTLANEVAEECKGLPLAIVTIGSALKGKPIDEWKLSLQKLKNSKFVNVEDADTNVYACLKLSYDYLKDEETKLCFLLCSLFPEDFEIPLEELVIYGTGIGLFREADNSIEAARSQVRVIVNNLKASGLLLDARREQFVKMHDIVRDVALWITSTQEDKFMSKAGLGLTEWPIVEGLEQYAAISLMYNEIKVLPVGLVCPKLEILLLHTKKFLFSQVQISDQFFVGMKALKVLSLGAGRLSLKSLLFFENIRSLQLHNCNLKDLDSIGKLSRLQILSLRESSFEELPKELGELGKLRLLNLCGCLELKRIPSNVIQRLSQLEELNIGWRSFTRWDVEGTSNVSLFELNSLRNLAILSLTVDEETIPKDFTFPKLQRYRIFVTKFFGHVEDIDGGHIRIYASSSSWPLIAFQALFQNLTYLELISLSKSRFVWDGCNRQHLSLHSLTNVEVSSCPSLTCLFTVSLARSLVHLKELSVRDCTMMKHIVEEEDGQFAFAGKGNHDDVLLLPQLRKLQLDGLENLIGFCPQNYNSMWPTLERLLIGGCHNLSSLFMAEESIKTLHMVNCDQFWDKVQSLLRYGFKNLQILNIAKCRGKVLFQLDGLEHELSLPTLKELQLDDFYELEALFKGPVQILSLKNLSTLALSHCPKLRHLFSTTLAQNMLQLKSLIIFRCKQLEQIIVEDGEQINQTSVTKDHRDLQSPCFPNLSEVRIIECSKLRSVFPITIARNLFLLEDLCIRNCQELEQIFVRDVEKDQNSLKDHLPLTCCSNLSNLDIQNCDKLKGLFHVTVARNLLQLKDLRIEDCWELEQIIVGDNEKDEQNSLKNHLQPESFSNLLKIQVKQCHELKGLFNVTMARNLLHLKDLSVEYCWNLEQIIVGDDGKEEQNSLKDHLQPESFSNLLNIHVKWCHKLKGLFHVAMARNLLHLKDLRIEDCWKLEQIIVGDDESEEQNSLRDHLQPGSFSNLLNIYVIGCRNLKGLFPFTVARNLLHLEHLAILDCWELEQIIVGTNEKEEQISLKDHLQPESFSNLLEIYVHGCHKLKVLFHVTVTRNLLHLKVLSIKDCWELEQIIVGNNEKEVQISLKDHLKPESFSNLLKISVRRCHKLKGLFHVTVARNLLHLKVLSIKDCRELEQIIVGDDDMKECKEIILHGVWQLSLENLPSLTNFCPAGYHFMFPSLDFPTVRNCPNITTDFSVDQNGTVHVQPKKQAMEENVSASPP